MEIVTIEPFLDYYERIRERTLRVIKCLPPDKIDWTYREGKFSFGDIMRHIASTERYMFAENVQLKPSRYTGHGRDLADGYDAALTYMRTLHEESMNIFSMLKPLDLQKRCETPGGTFIPVWKWLRAMVEHEIHHRGQIYMYLGVLDIPTPPIYGLTSEEVMERSQPQES
jgi:uncharacterized damage-inducible protein DinB